MISSHEQCETRRVASTGIVPFSLIRKLGQSPANTSGDAIARTSCLLFPFLLTVTFVFCGASFVQPAFAQNSSPSRVQPSRTAISDQALERVREHIRSGLDLAGRQAVYSAQQEFTQSLRLIANELDLAAGTRQHAAAVDDGLRALDSLDYVRRNGAPADANSAADASSGVSAIQQQLLYAQQRLAFGVRHEPAASMSLYLLGRSYTAIEGETAEERVLAGPRAIALYQAALVVDPANYLAANELGVILARYGQLDEARRVLVHGVSITSRPELWRNLSMVCDRMGDAAAARQARMQYEAIVAARPGDAKAAQAHAIASNLRWVKTEEFAQCSGDVDFDNPPAPETGSRPPQQPAAAPPAPTRNTGLIPNWMASGLRNLNGSAAPGQDR